MYHDEDAWDEFRSDMLNYMENLEKSIVQKWLDGIGYKDPVGYHICLSEHKIEIYTTRPGSLIGQAGIHVNELRRVLSEEFRGEWSVKFIEIRGGFVNV